MNCARWLGALLLSVLVVPTAPAAWVWNRGQVDAINSRLRGRLVDHTANHGKDRRIWSEALGKKRDLYVYLPPGFDPACQYPLIIWLHGIGEDEQSILTLVAVLDRAMLQGKLPPCIVAVPDGSIRGEPSLQNAGSFFINSDAGRFEDYIVHDVWNFLVAHYPIRPEREAHVLAGASMGGFGAYNLAFKHPDRFKVVVGMVPPLNLRWVDCQQRYESNFDPACWGWRTQLRPHEVVGRFLLGLVRVRLRHLTDPLFGRDPGAIEEISHQNPIEMLDRLGVAEGELDLYVGYGGRDQFNIDAQVESFLYAAHHRGLTVTVGYEPDGRHGVATGLRLLPDILRWLTPRLAPYAPPLK